MIVKGCSKPFNHVLDRLTLFCYSGFLRRISLLVVSNSFSLQWSDFGLPQNLHLSGLTVSISMCITFCLRGVSAQYSLVVALSATLVPSSMLFTRVWLRECARRCSGNPSSHHWNCQWGLRSSSQELFQIPLCHMMSFFNLVYMTPYCAFIDLISDWTPSTSRILKSFKLSDCVIVSMFFIKSVSVFSAG